MKTESIPAAELSRALEILASGGIVAFPTDTVYGLGALAFDNAAIESIYTAKDRPIEKAIPVLIGDLSDLDKIGIDIPNMALRFAARFVTIALQDAKGFTSGKEAPDVSEPADA